MKKGLKRLSWGLIAAFIIGLAVLWTPDTDRDEMIAKYTSETSRFVTDSQGMAIHYRDEGMPSGPVIVLLHGSGASLHTWEDMIEALSDTYRFISLDLPGHGLTGPDLERDYSASSMIDAVETVMETAGVEKAVIAGNSMGGWISWRYALTAPQRVEGLILIDAAGPQIGVEPNLYLAARIMDSALGRIAAKKITPKSIAKKTLTQVMYDDDAISDGLVERYWDLTRFPGNRIAMGDRAQVDREAKYWQRVSEIEVPVLILWGEHDVTTPLAFAHAFDTQIANTVLKIYPNAAHLPMEEIPADVAADIKIWMKSAFDKEAS